MISGCPTSFRGCMTHLLVEAAPVKRRAGQLGAHVGASRWNHLHPNASLVHPEELTNELAEVNPCVGRVVESELSAIPLPLGVAHFHWQVWLSEEVSDYADTPRKAFSLF